MDGSSAGGRGRARQALGRGLDALLPGAETVGLREVAVGRIEPNPAQPRQHFDPGALEELATSIREHGIVQPLVVSRIGDDQYRIIVGERRWQAAKLAGLEQVPVVVKEVSSRQTLEMALVENVQRADLNPLEEAAAYQRLVQDFGLTQDQVGKQIGKSRAAIANTLRLLLMPEALKSAVIEEQITEGHARALLALPTERAQIAGLKRVVQGRLTVRQTEEMVRRLAEAPAHTATRKNADLEAVESDLRRALGTKVTLTPRRRGGRIVIEYYSDDEFHGLYRRLLGED